MPKKRPTQDAKKRLKTARKNSNESLSGVSESESPAPTVEETLLVAQQNKWKNWWVRSLWTYLMIGGFIAILLSGHLFVITLVLFVITFVYREIIEIGLQPV